MSKEDWNQFYKETDLSKVFWYSDEIDTAGNWCLHLEEHAQKGFADLGGGLSKLTKAMVDNYASSAMLLDISSEAIEQQKASLKDLSANDYIEFVESDIFDWQPERGYGLVNDRGLFQWLENDDQKARYKALLKEMLVEDGRFILTQFSLRNPENAVGPLMSETDPLEAVDFFDDVFKLISMKRNKTAEIDGEREFIYHYHFALRPPL